MSQLYLWRPTDDASHDGETIFRHALATLAAEYEVVFGRDYRSRMRVGADGALVGQIAWDDGVVGWESWIEDGQRGIAWSGVCESLLHVDRSMSIPARVLALIDDPDRTRLDELEGRFAAVVWDDVARRTILVTGAIASPQLWQVDGPRGWAAGSRAVPLLEMVGQDRALDLDAATAFLAFGYLAGDRALFAGVKRIGGRMRIDATGRDGPVRRTFATIAQPRPALVDPTAAAQRLSTRIARQLAASGTPALLLTGGRDSRAIGAGLASAGFTGPAFTGGSDASPDVTVARRIAAVLGITHHRGSGAAATLVPDVALVWTRVSESTQSLRQAISHRRFFERTLPVPEERHQLFHGLGGEIARAYYYQGGTPTTGMPFLLAKADQRLPLRRPLEPVLAPILDGFTTDIAAVNPTEAQWLDLFYWQNRCLRWGTDLLAGADLMDWHWTPFLDAHWLGDAWNLDVRAKRSNAFVEAVTVALDARLSGLPYATDVALGGGRLRSVKRSAYHFAQRVAPGRVRRMRRGRVVDEAKVAAFMTSLLASGRAAAWHEIATPRAVASLIETDPGAEVLWSLATIELFERAFRT